MYLIRVFRNYTITNETHINNFSFGEIVRKRVWGPTGVITINPNLYEKTEQTLVVIKDALVGADSSASALIFVVDKRQQRK